MQKAFQEVADSVLQNLISIIDQPGGDYFPKALAELTGSQQNLNAWLVRFAPSLAGERKQADTALIALARTAAGLHDRVSEIRRSLGDEKDYRNALAATLPDKDRAAYEEFLKQGDAAADRARQLRKQSDGLLDSIEDPDRLQKAIAAATPEAQRLIREAQARKVQREVEQLYAKYLPTWTAENQQIPWTAKAKRDEAEKAEGEADTARQKAANILSTAYPKFDCIENLMAWFSKQLQ